MSPGSVRGTSLPGRWNGPTPMARSTAGNCGGSQASGTMIYNGDFLMRDGVMCQCRDGVIHKWE